MKIDEYVHIFSSRFRLYIAGCMKRDCDISPLTGGENVYPEASF